MTLTELIKELETKLAEVGDVEVEISSDIGWHWFTVEVRTSSTGHSVVLLEMD